MKQIIFTLLIFSTLYLSGQEVTNRQFQLITKRTADWCPKCGEYGWELFKNLEKNLKEENALIWAIHYSGNLKNDATIAVDEIFGGFGQPIFWLDDADLLVDVDNYKEIQTFVEDLVMSPLFSEAYIGVSLNLEQNSDNTYNIKAGVKSFIDLQANEYNLGIYLINDSLVAYQQSVGFDAVHSGVLTKSLIPEMLGKNVFKAPIANGRLENLEWKNVDLGLSPTENAANYRIAAILWSKDAEGATRFFNADVKNVSEAMVTSTYDVSLIDEVKLTLNGAQNQLFLESGDDVSNIIKTNLVNINGQSIAHLMGNKQGFSANVDILETLTPGVYYLQLQGLRGSKTYSFLAK